MQLLSLSVPFKSLTLRISALPAADLHTSRDISQPLACIPLHGFLQFECPCSVQLISDMLPQADEDESRTN